MADYTRVEACGGLEGFPYEFGSDAPDSTPVARVQNQHIDAPAGLPAFPNGSGAGPSASQSGPFANAFDPLTAKGSKIMSAMQHEYGEKKGESVFYASANAGKIKGVHKK